MGISGEGGEHMDLNTLLAVFTILSGIVAIFDLIEYGKAIATWIMDMILNMKK